jgi:hypothetical protein
MAALRPDDTVIGGGNVKKPTHCLRGVVRVKMRTLSRRISLVGGTDVLSICGPDSSLKQKRRVGT